MFDASMNVAAEISTKLFTIKTFHDEKKIY